VADIVHTDGAEAERSAGVEEVALGDFGTGPLLRTLRNVFVGSWLLQRRRNHARSGTVPAKGHAV